MRMDVARPIVDDGHYLLGRMIASSMSSPSVGQHARTRTQKTQTRTHAHKTHRLDSVGQMDKLYRASLTKMGFWSSSST